MDGDTVAGPEPDSRFAVDGVAVVGRGPDFESGT